MRNVINLNRDWRFVREDAGLPGELPLAWQKIDLPHTWNAVDGHDGNGGYYRGKCWYAKSFETPRQPLAGGKVYVEILAAGQQASVYVNGIGNPWRICCCSDATGYPGCPRSGVR